MCLHLILESSSQWNTGINLCFALQLWAVVILVFPACIWFTDLPAPAQNSVAPCHWQPDHCYFHMALNNICQKGPPKGSAALGSALALLFLTQSVSFSAWGCSACSSLLHTCIDNPPDSTYTPLVNIRSFLTLSLDLESLLLFLDLLLVPSEWQEDFKALLAQLIQVLSSSWLP